MNMNPAISGVGKHVLIIRGNHVIGKGRSVAMRGEDFVSVVLTEESHHLIPADHELIQMVGYKHASIRYYPNTGGYISMGCLLEDDDVLEDFFSDTLVVDEFHFRWGMVPDHFKTVDGYGAALTEDDE